MQVHVVAIAV